jgi:hypothetical protein
LLFDGHAHAQPSDANRTHAVELADQSDLAYQAGDFARAADLVRGAYALYPEPILLYNLARALERQGDVREAIAQYTRYLAAEAPDADDRDAVTAKIHALQAELPPEPARVVVVAPPPPRPEPAHLALPIATAAAGAVALGIGVGFGFASSRARGDAASAPVQLDAQRDLDRAHRDATVANVLFVAGGALAIGGAAWAYLAHGRAERGVASHLRISPSSIALRSASGAAARPTSVGLSIGVAWELP